jgi:NNP family nitrate/nitrite transporter-like MFS transporter
VAPDGRAKSIDLFDTSTVPMQNFHATWLAFFLCFFGWFGIAPLMPVVREDLGLTPEQVGNTAIASVAATAIARLLMGWLCDRIGPRKAYSLLLLVGSLPVAAIGLAQSYETFLLLRLAIGTIGASFVITQYHTSVMFAPNVVGTANATAAGWGNLGGGATQAFMPLLLAGVTTWVVDESLGWRVAMVVPGVMLLLMSFAYWRLTSDTPDGSPTARDSRVARRPQSSPQGLFREVARDGRVWALAVIYGTCFGMELTLNNVAALYYFDYFALDLRQAGLVVGLCGLTNLFARSVGGILGDRLGARWGLNTRVRLLGMIVLAQGFALIVFSRMSTLSLAIASMVLLGLCVQMASGATFAVVPFVNRRALGSVAGIVGAGGNVGAVAAGFLFRSPELPWPTAFLVLGFVALGVSTLSLAIRFAPEHDGAARAPVPPTGIATTAPAEA